MHSSISHHSTISASTTMWGWGNASDMPGAIQHELLAFPRMDSSSDAFLLDWNNKTYSIRIQDVIHTYEKKQTFRVQVNNFAVFSRLYNNKHRIELVWMSDERPTASYLLPPASCLLPPPPATSWSGLCSPNKSISLSLILTLRTIKMHRVFSNNICWTCSVRGCRAVHLGTISIRPFKAFRDEKNLAQQFTKDRSSWCSNSFDDKVRRGLQLYLTPAG